VIETQGRRLGLIPQLEVEKTRLVEQLRVSEADRAARLEVIEAQGQQLGQIPQLEARLGAVEAERDMLAVQLQASEADRKYIYANLLVRVALRTGLVRIKRH